MTLALDAAQLTGGDVDPTVGRALELTGYDRDWRLLASAARRAASAGDHGLPRAVGWRTVELDRASVVRIPAGVKLDLGATAKAWAADRAASAAARGRRLRSARRASAATSPTAGQRADGRLDASG